MHDAFALRGEPGPAVEAVHGTIELVVGPAQRGGHEVGVIEVGEFRERKGDRFVLVEVGELEGLEVADEEVARFVALWERIEVLERLVAGSREVPPGALLLDEQDPGPEQIDGQPGRRRASAGSR